MDFRARLSFGWSPLTRWDFSVCTTLLSTRLFFNASFKCFHASQSGKDLELENQRELSSLEMASENLAKYSVDCTFSKQNLAQVLIAVLAHAGVKRSQN